MTTPTPYTEVTITWTEEWRRSTTTKVNLQDLREWADITDPQQPITSQILTEYFAAASTEDQTWHPNNGPSFVSIPSSSTTDEFIDLMIDSVTLTTPSPRKPHAMTIKATDTWTCDRCGIINERTRGTQPLDWTGLILVTPPLREDSNTLIRSHLCAACTTDLATWMSNDDATQPSNPPNPPSPAERTLTLAQALKAIDISTSISQTIHDAQGLRTADQCHCDDAAMQIIASLKHQLHLAVVK